MIIAQPCAYTKKQPHCIRVLLKGWILYVNYISFKKFNATKNHVLLSTILPAKGKMAQQTGTKKRKEFLGFHFSICMGWISVLHWIFLKHIPEAAPLNGKLGHDIELHWQIIVPSFPKGVRSKPARNAFMHEFKYRIGRHIPAKLPLGSADSLSCLATAEVLTTPALGVRRRLISILERGWRDTRRMKLEEKLALIGYWSFNKNRALPHLQSCRL